MFRVGVVALTMAVVNPKKCSKYSNVATCLTFSVVPRYGSSGWIIPPLYAKCISGWGQD